MKRDQLIQEPRKIAKIQNIRFEVNEGRAKGSHYQVIFGDRVTTIKSGEMNPGYVRLIKKQLEVI